MTKQKQLRIWESVFFSKKLIYLYCGILSIQIGFLVTLQVWSSFRPWKLWESFEWDNFEAGDQSFSEPDCFPFLRFGGSGGDSFIADLWGHSDLAERNGDQKKSQQVTAFNSRLSRRREWNLDDARVLFRPCHGKHIFCYPAKWWKETYRCLWLKQREVSSWKPEMLTRSDPFMLGCPWKLQGDLRIHQAPYEVQILSEKNGKAKKKLVSPYCFFKFVGCGSPTSRHNLIICSWLFLISLCYSNITLTFQPQGLTLWLV